MDNKELSKKYNIELPSKIKFELDNTNFILRLYLNQKSLCEKNMQNNEVAFESWIFCLLPKIKTVTRVELDWEEPIKEKQNGHYNRFLYRVLKMKEHCSTWFNISESKNKVIEAFKHKCDQSTIVLNTPRKNATDILEKQSETYFEQLFFNKEKLNQKYGLEIKDRQLPVGAFLNKVSKSTHLFTGGRSAIDLWGIKDNELYIFELKYHNNMVGIITETLFYLWIMEDVMTGKMRYDVGTAEIEYRSFNKFHAAINKISRIHAVFLVDETHRQIDEEVIKFINSHIRVSQLRLSIEMCKYKPTTTIEFV